MSSSTTIEPPVSGKPKSTALKAIPDGMHSITPHLVCDGAGEAIEFYKKAFEAVELFRLPAPNGRLMHGCIQIGDSRVMLMDECLERGMPGPKALKGSPVVIHLQVEDADTTFATAVAAGATAIMPPADMFWGDRYGVLQDPFGHHWAVATHIQDLSPEEILKGSEKACCQE